MKKILFLMIFIFFLTGCNSYTELNKLGIIHTIGIEKIENQYKLYASIIENSLSSNIYEIEGQTIQECFTNLELTIPKKIYLSHLDLLIINSSIKTNEWKEITSFFVDNTETREDFLIVFTNNISNILKQSNWHEINDLLKINQKENSLTTITTMYDVIKNYYEKQPIYFTVIEFDKNILVSGIIKFIGNQYNQINKENTIFINYILNQVNSYTYNYHCSNGKEIILRINKAQKKEINNKIFITNEITILKNECSFQKEKIKQNFKEYLFNNLTNLTKKKIYIENNIRSLHEN